MQSPSDTEFLSSSTGTDAFSVEAAAPSEDWEEWDGRSPFWIHCVAGSIAGVVEHGTVYPLDTVRTHIQVCAACLQRKAATSNHSAAMSTKTGLRSWNHLHPPMVAANKAQLPTGMWQTIRFLMNESAAVSAAALPATHTTTTTTTSINTPRMFAGLTRLWRGLPTILVGCVPAHALYFGCYETVRLATRDAHGNVTHIGSSLAGAAAVTAHDIIMTPLDTLKQRMQLGHYRTMRQGAASMIQHEGWSALYRSFPVTLLTNIPYGMIMVTTHEAGKHYLSGGDASRETSAVVACASAFAGCTAAVLTTPLDRVKTALQTQQLTPACAATSAAAPDACPLLQSGAGSRPLYTSWKHAVQHIWMTEGPRGFFRGMVPRLLSHTPAVAISWTTYETAKHLLLKHYG
jgi:solute carrier family 25 (mitochondrial iron transporter), member 28/37